MSAALDSDHSGPWCGNQTGTSELDYPRVNGLPDLMELYLIAQSENNTTNQIGQLFGREWKWGRLEESSNITNLKTESHIFHILLKDILVKYGNFCRS